MAGKKRVFEKGGGSFKLQRTGGMGRLLRRFKWGSKGERSPGKNERRGRDKEGENCLGQDKAMARWWKKKHDRVEKGTGTNNRGKKKGEGKGEACQRGGKKGAESNGEEGGWKKEGEAKCSEDENSSQKRKGHKKQSNQRRFLKGEGQCNSGKKECRAEMPTEKEKHTE